jgi:hypothetical protein
VEEGVDDAADEAVVPEDKRLLDDGVRLPEFSLVPSARHNAHKEASKMASKWYRAMVGQ